MERSVLAGLQKALIEGSQRKRSECSQERPVIRKLLNRLQLYRNGLRLKLLADIRVIRAIKMRSEPTNTHK